MASSPEHKQKITGFYFDARVTRQTAQAIREFILSRRISFCENCFAQLKTSSLKIINPYFGANNRQKPGGGPKQHPEYPISLIILPVAWGQNHLGHRGVIMCYTLLKSS
jgi:hypothetical protein